MSNVPPTADRRALLQSALQAIDDMQSKLDSVERAARAPIAIVGMGCRFPGGANSPEEYWQLLRDGRDVVSEYPPDRQRLAAAAGIALDTLDIQTAWYGGFLEQLDQFDPHFFGISPREATAMDPQQRLVLETSWEALERAGIAPDSLNGSLAGVFVGITSSDYSQLAKLRGPAELDVYSATGGALNAVAGRVAYTLGLQGPCMAIDTACSSSLVAVHQACQSLRTGDCDMALAGGVNVVLMPEAFICFNRWGMMSSDGRCKTFDAAADGFVRSEGCGMLVLKRLSDAVAAGDPILAVIRGSAVNQDGRSSGLTVPNGPAQQAVLRKALASAGVEPAQVQYIEAHGTGTTLGDPIEVEAIGMVLGHNRNSNQPLMLGSVKTNLGHLESAAGIAGLIKVVLSMQHGAIPAHLHLHERSPKIPWPNFPVLIPTELTSWPAEDGRRLAGVSGFGFSGTNAHVVLESAPVREPDALCDSAPQVFVLSAKTEPALRELAAHFVTYLDTHSDVSLADICGTVATGRAQFAQRLAVVADSTSRLRERLSFFAAHQSAAGVVHGQSAHPRIAFLFTGQGAQYGGMAHQLYLTQPVFRAAFDQCADLLQAHLDRPLAEIVFDQSTPDEEHPLHQTIYTQPALFALEYALAELWRTWGVVPQAVMGHSVGEYVAAVTAGVFSLEDGLRLIAARGRLMQALPADGAMAAIFAPADQVRDAVAPHAARLAVAAINGPEHTVIAGAIPAVEQVMHTFATKGVRVQQLRVSHAFHSPLMEPMLRAFAEVAASVTYNAPRITMIANITGELADEAIATPEYWVRHVLATVQFTAGVTALHRDGFDTFIEVGPHPVLLGMGKTILPAEAGSWIPSLRRNRSDREQLLDSLATLYVQGARINWPAVQGQASPRVSLPTYPFQRQRYWIDPPKRRERGRSTDTGTHPLLGHRTRSPLVKDTIFEAQVNIDDLAWLADHRVYNSIVFPGSAYLEMALAANASPRPATIESLLIQEALLIPESEATTLQTIVSSDDHGAQQVRILSVKSASDDAMLDWKLHATATLRAVDSDPAHDSIDVATLIAAFHEEVEIEGYYQKLRDLGLEYGPAFRALTRLLRSDGTALGLIELAATGSDAAAYHLHPALLDACFHVIGVATTTPTDSSEDVFVPIAANGLRLYRSGVTAVWCVAEIIDSTSAASQTMSVCVRIYDTDGLPVASIERLDLKRAPRTAWQRAAQDTVESPLYSVTWQPQQRAPRNWHAGTWLVFADASGIGEQVVQHLVADGATCLTVRPGAVTEEYAPGYWRIDHADPDAYKRVLDQAATYMRPLQGIVYLWGIDCQIDSASVVVEAAQDVILRGALHLTQALVTRNDLDARLWVVTQGAQATDGEPADLVQATLWGLGRVVANEQPRLRYSCVDLDPISGHDSVQELVAELQTASSEDQIAYRGERRLVARLTHFAPAVPLVDHLPYQLTVMQRGSLENIAFASATRRAPGPGEIEIEVRATGLNFRDILNVLGMYPGDPGPPGLECAGTITAIGEGVTDLVMGDSVLGIAPHAFDAYVVTKAHLVVRKPDILTFAEAATMPIAYLTAYYGLHHLAHLQPGERVLIHAAAGGVGMAAVSLALCSGAEVFATVGSAEKRRVLESLGVRHIYSSRTLDFADQIMADTGGAGVDIILNSLADAFIAQSFAVLAPRGRFLEIGKRGIWTADEVRASHPEAAYFPYDLADFQHDPEHIKATLQTIVDSIAEGNAGVLPLRAFPARSIVDAFRYMAQARHIGKVVITHNIAQRTPVRSDGSYLITGGLGGLGLEVAGWLVEQGARHLALIGRREPSAAAMKRIQALQQAGAQVLIVEADVAKQADVTRVITTLCELRVPLRGVIHAAGVLNDGVLEQQRWERFVPVLAPKTTGAWLLHHATRGLPIDFFVLFSSASALLGSVGQANYAAANASLDALAHLRRAQGLPALSINWGAWAKVGMAAALNNRDQQRIASRGIGTIDPDMGVQTLGKLLEQDAPQVAVLPIDWTLMLAQFAPNTTPPLLFDMRSAVAHLPTSSELVADQGMQDLLARAAPHEQKMVIMTYVQTQIIRVLGLDPTIPIDPRQGLTEIGMDSLMAVELSNRLRASVKRSLPATLAFEYPTLNDITTFLATEILNLPSDGLLPPPPSSDGPSLADELEQLSEEEAEDILLRELEESGY